MLDEIEPDLSEAEVVNAAKESPEFCARYDRSTLKVIGHGAQAVVTTVFCPHEERDLVAKLLRVREINEHSRRRFREEMLHAKRAQSRYVVPVNTVTFGRGVSWIEEEFVPGVTLLKVLGDHGGKPVPFERACAMATALFEALSIAHNRGVIHRDIKPANLLVPEEGAILPHTHEAAPALMVLDFGVSREGHLSLRATSTFPGTPLYAPPETYSGEGFGAATDVYSATLVCYEIFTGQYAFALPNNWAEMSNTQRFALLSAIHLRQTDQKDPRPALALCTPFPGELSATLSKGLALDPAGRPSPDQVVAALKNVPPVEQWEHWDGTTAQLARLLPEKVSETTGSRKPIQPQPSTKTRIPKPRLLGLGIVALGLVATLGAWLGAKRGVSNPVPSTTIAAVVPPLGFAVAFSRGDVTVTYQGPPSAAGVPTDAPVQNVTLMTAATDTQPASSCTVAVLRVGQPTLLWAARWQPALPASPTPSKVRIVGTFQSNPFSEDVPVSVLE